VFGVADIPPIVPLTAGRGKNDEPDGLVSDCDGCDSVSDGDRWLWPRGDDAPVAILSRIDDGVWDMVCSAVDRHRWLVDDLLNYSESRSRDCLESMNRVVDTLGHEFRNLNVNNKQQQSVGSQSA
jgi:hypothetical protein